MDDGLGAAGLEGDLKPRLVAQRQPEPPCGQKLIIDNSAADPYSLNPKSTDNFSFCEKTFKSKTAIYLFLGLDERLPRYRRVSSPPKRLSSTSKLGISSLFYVFLGGIFWLTRSGFSIPNLKIQLKADSIRI